jgi:hypothetical protein|tara:strand:- start:1041 stop:2246 length:1206 start_codon:yes stop_codon:yes gene_type:complete
MLKAVTNIFRTVFHGLIYLSLAFSLVVAVTLVWLWPSYDYLPEQAASLSVQRLSDGPIIETAMSARLTALAAEEGYSNINGPSLIAVPDWVENPLGNYYLYFSHHKGDFIRLAYADKVEGPWSIYEPGALELNQSGFPTDNIPPLSLGEGLAELWDSVSIYLFRDSILAVYQAVVTDQEIRKQRGIAVSQSLKAHIASPEVVVDDPNQQIVMFFHGQRDSLSQVSGVAVSTNGVDFIATERNLGGVYLRSFAYQDQHYFLAAPGILYRSDELLGDYQPRQKSLFGTDARHSAVLLQDDQLTVVWSRVGDAPERLLVSTVSLSSSDWDDWVPTYPTELMRAEQAWEGSELPVQSSLRGETNEPTNDLRDPELFVDADGQIYLLYVASGEQSIGIVGLSGAAP